MKRCFSFLALAVAALVMPALSRADSFTFSISGSAVQVPVTSFSFGVSSSIGVGRHPTREISLVSPLPDPLGAVLLADLHGGTGIASMTLDAYKEINGVSTLIESFEFDKDFVVAIQLSFNGRAPSEDVTFSYESTKFTSGGGTGPIQPPVPEPTTLLLLGSGAAAVCALRKKRLA